MTEVRSTRIVERAGPWGLVMVMAYVGAAVYFVSRSDGGFWSVVISLLQAIIWPAYAVYHLLQVLAV